MIGTGCRGCRGATERVLLCLISGNQDRLHTIASFFCAVQASRSCSTPSEWSYPYPDGRVCVLGTALRTDMHKVAVYLHQIDLRLSYTADHPGFSVELDI